MNAAIFAPTIPVVLEPHRSDEPPSNYQHNYNQNQLASVHSCKILPFSLTSSSPPPPCLPLGVFIDIKSFTLETSFCKTRDKELF